MEQESQNHFKDETVIYTGIGKVNATFALTKKLMQLEGIGKKPSLVLNFGSCGSQSFVKNSIVEVSEFHQADMDVTPLGFAKGITPFDQLGQVLKAEIFYTELPKAVCETADVFQTQLERKKNTVVEMEAYALAKVCRKLLIPFVAIKHVTDGADGQAHNDWAENVKYSAAEFKKILNQLRSD